ncbi:MAG: sulfotransferase, partial [Mariprofundaceae bacterium]|nr:sulfotransferase [Mariprofundaceae bacterium]
VDRVDILNAMGIANRKLGLFHGSFDYFQQANAIRASLRDYDAEAALKDMDRIMQAYSPEAVAHPAGIPDVEPILVVGLPGCGSTLVEQILAAHSQVSGRGEIDAFASVLRETFVAGGDADIAALASLTEEQWAELGGEYLERLRVSGPDSQRIVDKSLNNCLLLGAIHCAMPQARIVHVRRHPLDICLSIYTSNIQGSLYDYGLRLETLGEYCKKYLELMSHWRKALPAGVMYELDYEQLVSNQEEETRGLLEACGLPWEEQCLNFQAGGERVNTASIMQVRQPMYTKSVARWKRYEKELKPLIDILGTDYPDL